MNSRRIAVLTFHRALNCGAVLQAWALQMVLRRLGFDPEFPECNEVGVRTRFDKRQFSSEDWFQTFMFWMGSLGIEDLKRWRFNSFVARYLSVVAITKKRVERRYDAVLVGSDQVWNYDLVKDERPYFLTTMFRREDLLRYSYAASFGDHPLDDSRREKLLCAGLLFENISVREDVLPEMKDRKGRGPTVDLDPTLLLTREDYASVATPRRIVAGKYLFVYTLGYRKDLWAAAREMSNRLGLKLVVAQMYKFGKYRIWEGKGVDIAVSPDRFLAYFRDAEAVITNSFHGTAFSVVYEKPFAVLPGKAGRIPFRCIDLLKKINEESRIVANAAKYADIERALRIAVSPSVRERIARLASDSINHLRAELPDISAAPSPVVRSRCASGCPWLLRKVLCAIRCVRENGVHYTIRRLFHKLLCWLG